MVMLLIEYNKSVTKVPFLIQRLAVDILDGKVQVTDLQCKVWN